MNHFRARRIIREAMTRAHQRAGKAIGLAMMAVIARDPRADAFLTAAERRQRTYDLLAARLERLSK